MLTLEKFVVVQGRRQKDFAMSPQSRGSRSVRLAFAAKKRHVKEGSRYDACLLTFPT